MSGDGERGRGGDAAAGPDVKICGLGRRADVDAAVEAGAEYLGFVFADSPRRVTPARAAELAADVPARSVGVFVDAAPVEVLRTAEAVPLDVVQLHGSESPDLCESLRGAGVRVWKALRPRSAAELEELADRYRESVDGLLVEGHTEEAAGGTGTGFPHEWWDRAGLGRRGADDGPALILAGGLTPSNVADALARTAPQVVDVSSGVEREPGVKDPSRVRAFVRAAGKAGRRGEGGSGQMSGGGDRRTGAGEPAGGDRREGGRP